VIFSAFGSGAVLSGIFRMVYFPFWLLFSLNGSSLLFFPALLFAPLVSHWGYRNGEKLFSIRRRIVFRK
jgi:hypothetical protein